MRSDYIDNHLDTSSIGRDFNKRVGEKDINIFKERFLKDQSEIAMKVAS
jgi:hypothetical protein